MEEQSYILAPRSTTRVFAIAAVIDVIGIVLLAVGFALNKWYVIIPGVVVILGGAVLLSLTMMMRVRVSTTVRLTDEQLSISAGGKKASAAWSEISDVSSGGQTIYLTLNNQQPALKIDSPRGADDPKLQELATELTRRLDQNRGYRPL